MSASVEGLVASGLFLFYMGLGALAVWFASRAEGEPPRAAGGEHEVSPDGAPGNRGGVAHLEERQVMDTSGCGEFAVLVYFVGVGMGWLLASAWGRTK